MKVKGRKSSLWLGNCIKLATRFYRPFEVLIRIGTVAYELVVPPIVKIDNVFHVSLLKKYVYASNHVLDWYVIHVEYEGEL